MEKFIKKFTLRYIYFIVFISLIAWAFFAYFTMNSQIHSQEIYAKIINLSGKQRMLSQKTTLIAKRYFESKDEFLKNHLKELINIMKNDYLYITNNLTSENMRNIYFLEDDNLDEKVKHYFKLITDFYETNNPILLKEIENNSFKLLPFLDKAVNSFQKESNDKTTELLKREQFILIGTLLTLLLEAIFIVIPSIRITARKEKELNDLNDLLKTKIDQAVKENLEKEKIIQQQFHLIQMEELIVNISHQWRQPLSLISAVTSNLKISKEIGDVSKEMLEQNLNLIMEKVTFLSNTFENLNEFIEIDDNKENINLHQTIDKTILVLDSTLKDNNINVIKNFNDNSIYFTGNSIRLSRALLSIFENSKDFLIQNQTQNSYIKITTYTKNEFAYIEIEDNAGGIEEKNLKKIFDIYFTTKHQSQGKGVGLYISYSIIKNSFEGSINVENQESGVKFIVKIPIN